MSTFWKRIREVMFGPVLDEDMEVGALQESSDTSGPVSFDAYGSTLEIRYCGPLAQKGEPLYVHFGVGPGPWQHVHETPMRLMGDGTFHAEIGIPEEEGQLEFCFRNDQGEWDNNGGNNWVYPLIW